VVPSVDFVRVGLELPRGTVPIRGPAIERIWRRDRARADTAETSAPESPDSASRSINGIASNPSISGIERSSITTSAWRPRTQAEIGEQFGVSAITVKTHVDNIYIRLGVIDKATAVAAALRRGLIE
jgi:hypothetical protein